MPKSFLYAFSPFFPELWIVCFILLLLLLSLVKGHEKSIWTVALLGLAMALFYNVRADLVIYKAPSFLHLDMANPNRMLAFDRLAVFFKYFFLAAGALVVLMSARSKEIEEETSAEYYALLLTVVLGMTVAASSVNLLTIYLGLEIMGLTSYVLAGYRRGHRPSGEAALKYLLFGGVSTGVMLLGMSYLYGLCGTTDLLDISAFLAQNPDARSAAFIASLLVLAGLSYKIAAAPFHFWCPDVYQGAPTPVTALLSVGPKAAGFAVIIRFFMVALMDYRPGTPGLGGTLVKAGAFSGMDWTLVMFWISIITMTLGNLAALAQTSVKRLLAYSSIAHAGYILMATLTFSQNGLWSLLFYLVVYLTMNLGAFTVVVMVVNHSGSDDIEEFGGLGRRAPFVAVTMCVFLFSLTGIPPFAGFAGKLLLFAEVIHRAEVTGAMELYVLVLAGALNSVVSLFYYARVAKAMYFAQPKEGAAPFRSSPLYVGLLGLLALPNILFGLYWQPLLDFVKRVEILRF